MPRVQPLSQGLGRAALVLLCATVPASFGAVTTAAPSGETVLTPAQMRAAATQLLKVSNPKQAMALAEALISRDPEDRTALLIKSRAARDLGDYPTARKTAKQAWSLAETDSDRYAAALIMAQALSSGGQRTMAQFWLRRAVEHAPDEQLERRAVRDFRYLRASTPWLHRFSFSVSPESNINNGSSERSSFLNYELAEVLLGQPVEFELGGTQMALSGIEYAVGLRSRYRFHETETRAHDLAFSLDARSYTLSSEAKAQAPGAEGSDFAFATYQMGYGLRGINLDRRGEFRVAADLGQSWYGGEEYARFLRLSAGQSYKLDRGRRINARLSHEIQDGVATSDQDTWRADLSYSFKLPSGATLWTNLSVAGATSNYAPDEFEEVGLRTQLTLGKPILGATAQFGLWGRVRDYDVSPHSPDGRHDDRYQADVSLTFNKIDYYGFNPTVSISASKLDSNIGLYESHRFGVNFGIQSAF
ncbi:surface lipoprotein assembly modifier [Pseudophaeobacter sp. 1A16562]|uniref:surface lipoprotein assembly modifier n=1 Tax=unclassified Pseudophaeobacter TaxID=2637024 RepID=UPI0034D6BEDC